MIILKPLICECLQCVASVCNAVNEVGKNTVAVVRTISPFKEEVVGQVDELR